MRSRLTNQNGSEYLIMAPEWTGVPGTQPRTASAERASRSIRSRPSWTRSDSTSLTSWSTGNVARSAGSAEIPTLRGPGGPSDATYPAAKVIQVPGHPAGTPAAGCRRGRGSLSRFRRRTRAGHGFILSVSTYVASADGDVQVGTDGDDNTDARPESGSPAVGDLV